MANLELLFERAETELPGLKRKRTQTQEVLELVGVQGVAWRPLSGAQVLQIYPPTKGRETFREGNYFLVKSRLSECRYYDPNHDLERDQWSYVGCNCSKLSEGEVWGWIKQAYQNLKSDKAARLGTMLGRSAPAAPVQSAARADEQIEQAPRSRKPFSGYAIQLDASALRGLELIVGLLNFPGDISGTSENILSLVALHDRLVISVGVGTGKWAATKAAGDALDNLRSGLSLTKVASPVIVDMHGHSEFLTLRIVSDVANLVKKALPADVDAIPSVYTMDVLVNGVKDDRVVITIFAAEDCSKKLTEG